MEVNNSTSIVEGMGNLSIQEKEWMKGLPRLPKPFLKLNLLSPSEVDFDSLAKLERDSRKDFGGNNVSKAKLVNAKRITSQDALKRCLHLELEIDDSITYLPGDALGFFCRNEDEFVNSILKRLNLSPSLQFTVSNTGKTELPQHLKRAEKEPITVFIFFSFYLDFTSPPKKATLRAFAEYCSNASDKESLLFLSSRAGSEEYRKMFEKPFNILELLEKYPSCNPPLDRIVELLPPLLPRYYSACSSPLLHANRFEFAFNVIEYDYNSTKRRGLCTSQLELLATPFLSSSSSESIEIEVFKRPSTNFRLPLSDEKNSDVVTSEMLNFNILMIAAGTGVAPFRSFLQHLSALYKSHPEAKRGENWLFFGCRHRDKDFIYQQDFEQLKSEGTLTRIFTAFSRENPEKKFYVQDSLEQNAAEVYHFITEQKCIIYLCGDARGLMKGVNDALARIMSKHGNMEELQAQKLLAQWMKEKRYLIEVW